jgi:hypothetical protein
VQAIWERFPSWGRSSGRIAWTLVRNPPLKSRSQLREVATAIWPILAGTHAKLFIQDAAILGLHVQTERLFIIN